MRRPHARVVPPCARSMHERSSGSCEPRRASALPRLPTSSHGHPPIHGGISQMRTQYSRSHAEYRIRRLWSGHAHAIRPAAGRVRPPPGVQVRCNVHVQRGAAASAGRLRRLPCGCRRPRNSCLRPDKPRQGQRLRLLASAPRRQPGEQAAERNHPGGRWRAAAQRRQGRGYRSFTNALLGSINNE